MRSLISYLYIRKIAPVVFIFTVACTVQLFFLSLLPDELSKNESPDFTVFYSVIADRLESGEDFTSSFYFKGNGNNAVPSDKTGTFVTRWPPGHPIIIASIYGLADHLGINRDNLVTITFLLLYSFASCLIYKIASLFFEGYTPLLSGIIWATYPFNLWLTKQPNSEIPFFVFFFWSIYMLIIGIRSNSTKFIIGASILISLAMLVRAAAILVPFIFVISYMTYYIFKRNEKNGWNFKNIFKKSFIMIALPIIITAPWEALVYKETGKLLPLTSTGADLIRITNLNILKPRPDGALIVSDELKHYLASTLSFEERCSIISDYCDANRPIIISKKSIYISAELYWIKFKRAFHGIDTKRFEDEVTLVQCLYFIPILFGLVLTIRKKDIVLLNIIIASLSLYFISISMIGLPLLRYMLPAFGLYAMYAASSTNWLLEKILKRQKGN